MKRRHFLGGITASSLASFSAKLVFDHFEKKGDVEEINEYIKDNMEGYNSQVDSDSPYQENPELNVLVDSQYNIVTGSESSFDIILEGSPREDIDKSEPGNALDILKEDVGSSYLEEFYNLARRNLDDDLVDIENIGLVVQDSVEHRNEPFTYVTWRNYGSESMQQDWCRASDENPATGEYMPINDWNVLQE